MAFNNTITTLLEVFTNLGKLGIKIVTGTNTQGVGQGVIQMYTNTSSETFPGEITAHQEANTSAGVPPVTYYQDELDLTSPGILADPTMGRANVYLIAGDNTGNGATGRSTFMVRADMIDLNGDGRSPLADGQMYIGSDTTINSTHPLNVQCGIDTKTSATQPKSRIPLQLDLDRGAKVAITNFGANISARTPATTWPCWVTPIGNDLVLIQAHIVAAAAIPSGTDLFILPAGFIPTNQYMEVSAYGGVAPVSGKLPLVEIAPTSANPAGSSTLYNGTIAAGLSVQIFGVFSLT